MSFSSAHNSLWGVWVLRRDGSGSSATASNRRDFGSSLARHDSRPVTNGTSGGGSTGGSSTGGSTTAGGTSSDGNSSDRTVAKKNSETVGDVLLDIAVNVALYAVLLGVWTYGRSLYYSYQGIGGDVDQALPGAEARLVKIMKRRGITMKERLHHHETHIAEDIIDPEDIDEGFADIGGLDELKREVFEIAILPLRRPELFRGASKLLQQPPGILLYGLPGVGKTLLAKAIAAESDAVFIPIKLSKILNKWVGESNKLVAATFSLARKVAPAIIFIDEIDTFLSGTVDPSAGKSMESLKAQFLTEWEGINTNRKQAPVLVLGATNRPELIDPAILRRMPRSFEVKLPDEKGREQILQVLLDDQPMDKSAEAFIPELAKDRYTKGFSGSDLRELCRVAASEPIREIAAEESRKAVMGESKSQRSALSNNEPPKPKKTPFTLYRDFVSIPSFGEDDDNSSNDDESVPDIRPITEKDFRVALGKVKRTGQSAQEYGRRTRAGNHSAMPPMPQSPMDMLASFTPQQRAVLLRQLQALISAASEANGGSGDDDEDSADIRDVPPPMSE